MPPLEKKKKRKKETFLDLTGQTILVTYLFVFLCPSVRPLSVA